MWQAGNRLCSAVQNFDLSNQISQCLVVTKDFIKKGKSWLTAIGELLSMPPCIICIYKHFVIEMFCIQIPSHQMLCFLP